MTEPTNPIVLHTTRRTPHGLVEFLTDVAGSDVEVVDHASSRKLTEHVIRRFLQDPNLTRKRRRALLALLADDN